MWRSRVGLNRRGQNSRFWSQNGIVLLSLWCVLVALCFGVIKCDESFNKPTGDHGGEYTTVVVMTNDATEHGNKDDPYTAADMVSEDYTIPISSLMNDAHDGNETDDIELVERFKVAHFDWERVQIPMIISLLLLIATLAKIVFHLHHKLSALIPESCILIVVGVLIGLILFYTGFNEVDFYQLESDLFFFVLLPPIILDAGYFMPTRAFFDNIGTILAYAILGTLFNTLLIGFTLWGISFTGIIHARFLPLSLLEVLTFASLLSAVDPVAVLAVFEEAHVNEVLYIIVFGESLLNDGVTVVLYHMFEGFTEIGEENLLLVDIWAGIGSFFVVAGCGTLIGVVFGCLASLLTRITNHIPVIQPLLVLITGYMAYVFAEMFHLSGILACTFCGITMKRYVEANMTRKSHTTTKYFLKLLGSVSETIVFMYLGFSTVTNTHRWDWAFSLITLAGCLVFRSIVVLLLTAFVNIRRMPKLGNVDQFIMAYGGLRGAIAFSLVIVLDEHLFENKNLYITTTVFVVYFTNFIMGSTIKPLVKALRVPRADKHKPSLNEQIHTRFIDHLMAGIEDISGQSGHHQLRERFERFDKNYLQKIFVRSDAHMQRGWSIINVYDKLNQRDAFELLHGNHDYSELFTQLQRDPMTLRNTSFLRLLSSIGNHHSTNGFSRYHSASSSSLDIGDQTQVDLQALEAQDTRKMRDDSKVHHIIEDVMYMPRKRYTSNRRPMLPTDAKAQRQQMHHNARLHLRHLMSPHNNHHCNGHHNSNHDHNGSGKPKKNVSFAEVTQVSNSETDPDVGSTKAESGGEDSDNDSTSSDNCGITFTVTSSGDLDEVSGLDVPVEPVAVEMSLPWKRNTGREPLTCSVTHSMPDDQHPLIGEAPSWVSNTEYTSPGSPPATPQPRQPLHKHATDGTVPSSDSDSSQHALKLDCDHEDAAALQTNLISFHSPDHKIITPGIQLTESHDQNDELLRCVSAIKADSDVTVLKDDTRHAKSKGADIQANGCPDKFSSGSEPNRADDNGNMSSDSPVPANLSEAELAKEEKAAKEPDPPHPWRDNSQHPWRDISTTQRSSTDQLLRSPHQPSMQSQENTGEASCQLPWRTNNNTVPETNTQDKVSFPWHQNSQDFEENLPWRSPIHDEQESGAQLPLPWRQSSFDTSNDETSSLPWNSKHKADESSSLPTWRQNNVSRVPSNSRPGHNRSHSDADMDTNDGPPLPWRNTSNVEVKLDQCAPRPQQTSPNPSQEEQSHVPPPPWRHTPDPESSIRSPSATGTFYSLKPQLSSQSFRISEAESKHSEPIHVHHMIDISHGQALYDVDGGDGGQSLDLDHQQVDLHERVMLWLMASDPDPLQTEDIQLDLLPSANNNNSEVECQRPTGTGSVENSAVTFRPLLVHPQTAESTYL